MSALSLEFPEDLLAEIGEERARTLAKEALLVRLYDLGKVSSGKAAELLGISRRAFLDVLGRYGVSEFDSDMDIAEEARQ